MCFKYLFKFAIIWKLWLNEAYVVYYIQIYNLKCKYKENIYTIKWKVYRKNNINININNMINIIYINYIYL